VIYIIIIGVICGVLLWLNDAVPVPEPFHRIVRVVVIVVGVLLVILLLLQFIGVDGGMPRLTH
jgi:hypothetical protein